MIDTSKALKVAFIVGGLTHGGAEKQFLYMARSLQKMGATVRVFCLTKGDPYEKELLEIGLAPIWIGAHPNPVSRLIRIISLLRDDPPHFVQATHFFTNLYAAIAARMVGAISIGSIRSDPEREVRANGRWGRWLLGLPDVLIANSEAAREKAVALGISRSSIHVLPNVIDLNKYTHNGAPRTNNHADQSLTVLSVARLVSVKRFDRLLQAIALARRQNPSIQGVIVGDGPEMSRYRSLAVDLGLLPDGVQFTGMRSDIPYWLSTADIFCLTSDQEGFPNVVLEAMAAGLPVITTPAGDAGVVVQHGITGFVIEMDDIDALSDRILELAANPGLRDQLGTAARRRVETLYSAETLGSQLIRLYQAMAVNRGHQPAVLALKRYI